MRLCTFGIACILAAIPASSAFAELSVFKDPQNRWSTVVNTDDPGTAALLSTLTQTAQIAYAQAVSEGATTPNANAEAANVVNQYLTSHFQFNQFDDITSAAGAANDYSTDAGYHVLNNLADCFEASAIASVALMNAGVPNVIDHLTGSAGAHANLLLPDSGMTIDMNFPSEASTTSFWGSTMSVIGTFDEQEYPSTAGIPVNVLPVNPYSNPGFSTTVTGTGYADLQPVPIANDPVVIDETPLIPVPELGPCQSDGYQYYFLLDQDTGVYERRAVPCAQAQQPAPEPPPPPPAPAFDWTTAYLGNDFYPTYDAYGNVIGYSYSGEGQLMLSGCSYWTCPGLWQAPPPPPPDPVIYTPPAPTVSSQSRSAYVGCYTDSSDRALPNLIAAPATVESCIAAANAMGYKYAGLQFGGQCFAGDTLGYSKVDDSQCNMPCGTNTAVACGASFLNSVYLSGALGAAPSISTTYDGGAAGGSSYLNIVGAGFVPNQNQVTVTCDGSPVNAAINNQSQSTFIQIYFPGSADTRSCTVSVLANGQWTAPSTTSIAAGA